MKLNKQSDKQNSFFRETIRNQKWLILLLSLVQFVLYPMSLILTITQYQDRELSELTTTLNHYFAYNVDNMYTFKSYGETLLMSSLFIGVICGILSFAYLHSKRQVALYHSIPVSRKRLLLTKLASFTIVHMLPLFVANVLFVMILFSRGFLFPVIVQQMFVMLYYHLMLFWMGYFLAAIAMLVTGKLFVGVLGVGVFMAYFPVLASVLNMYQQEFFYHIYTKGSHYLWGNFEKLARISPVTYIECLEWNNAMQCGIVLITVVILGRLHYALMKIRPSEVAGRSMAYQSIGMVIQAFLLFIAAIGLGIVTHVSFYNTTYFLYLGGTFGVVVGYIVLQLLYGVEFKELLRHKWMPIVVGVVSIAVMATLQFDLLGYNSYLPDYDNLADINIEFTEDNQYSTGYIEEGIYEAHMGKSEDTYALMEMIIESSTRLYETDNGYGNGIEIYVEYILDNGTVVKQTYYPYTEDVSEGLKELWNNQEFLNVMYPIRTQDASLTSSITMETIEWDEAYSDMNIVQLYLFEDEEELRIAFMEAYQKDALGIDETTTEEVPIGRFEYRLQGPIYQDYYDVFIYPSYENTLAFLEEQGIELFYDISAEEVSVMEVYENLNIGGEETAVVEDDILVYTDKASIEVLLDDMVTSDLMTIFTDIDETKMAYVTLERGVTLTYYFLNH